MAFSIAYWATLPEPETLYWHICCYRRKLTDAELEACYRYDKQFWEHYSKKCRWPIRNVPWGASSVKYS
ncbi:hypothetical protein EIZ89_16765 [Escherichia coli]|nr:hypothetical protein [Escherichia coli]